MNYYVGDFPPNEMFAPKGWICPKCGRVYSPSTPSCYYCGGNTEITTTTNITVGGSDYWDIIEKAWKNKLNNQSNKIEGE